MNAVHCTGVWGEITPMKLSVSIKLYPTPKAHRLPPTNLHRYICHICDISQLCDDDDDDAETNDEDEDGNYDDSNNDDDDDGVRESNVTPHPVCQENLHTD